MATSVFEKPETMATTLENATPVTAVSVAQASPSPRATAEAPSDQTADLSTSRISDDRWANVECVLRRHYHNPDLQGARALYAAVAAHDLAGQPVWPMAVAPPGSMKTELIRALDGMERVFSIDAVTSKTFISGQIRPENLTPGTTLRPSSLLLRIGDNGIVLCPDFSTILSIKSEERNSVLADMRRIYDGDLRKEFGTSEPVVMWKGRITFVVAVTEDIDKHHSVIQSLGDRFVMIRWARGGQEAAMRAMSQDINQARADLRSAVHDLFRSLVPGEPQVSEAMRRRLAALAEFAARGRSYVPRGGLDKAIIGEPQAESATRLAQQLCQLVKGSARLSHRTMATPEDFETAHRAALDCIPARRKVLLERGIRGDRLPGGTSTQMYDREDLQVLGLVEGDRLSEFATQLLRQIQQSDEDFTTSPPNANDRIPRGSGGNSGEGEGSER